MEERPLIEDRYYKISLREKFTIFLKRFIFIPYFLIRYKMRKIIKTEFKTKADVFIKYFRDYELHKILNRLGIRERDATAAIKVVSYLHALSGTTGEVTEMTPRRCVRIETKCQAAKLFSRKFCRDTLSVPTFTAIGKAINPNMVHIHETFLSDGDSTCTLIFELKE